MTDEGPFYPGFERELTEEGGSPSGGSPQPVKGEPVDPGVPVSSEERRMSFNMMAIMQADLASMGADLKEVRGLVHRLSNVEAGLQNVEAREKVRLRKSEDVGGRLAKVETDVASIMAASRADEGPSRPVFNWRALLPVALPVLVVIGVAVYLW